MQPAKVFGRTADNKALRASPKWIEAKSAESRNRYQRLNPARGSTPFHLPPAERWPGFILPVKGSVNESVISIIVAGIKKESSRKYDDLIN